VTSPGYVRVKKWRTTLSATINFTGIGVGVFNFEQWVFVETCFRGGESSGVNCRERIFGILGFSGSSFPG
jgi:hypothetical protein